MVPGSQTPGDVPAARSGGKILKSRKFVDRKTPYDRPTQPQPPLPQENPNWLSGLVSPAKYVAGGATKILSSIWNPKTWATPSSSSEETDYDSEDESGDDENASHEVIELNQQQQQDTLYQKNETLHLIEQLLMLEQFSREEGNRLIEIINSRVVDYSVRDCVDAGPSMKRSSTNNETPDIRSQTILEAKRWVEENKVKSVLKSNLDNGPVTTPQATEAETGSPIDVAKSYMKARPPWASPLNLEKSLTPSPLFKEKTPYSYGGGASSAKRDYLSAGTWNIQEEIRRVRTKATEDMLNSHRSIKYASSSNLQDDAPIHSLANDKSINVIGRDEPISFGTPKSVEETVNLAADETPLSLSDVRTAQDVLPTESLPSNPIMPVVDQHEGINSDKRQTTGPTSEGNKLEMEEIDRQPNERNTTDQENGTRAYDVDRADKNGYPLTESPIIINNSQCSSNTNDDVATKIDGTIENRAVTRSSRRGKARGK